MRYTICFYRDGNLVHEAGRDARNAAELMALEGLRGGCEVTIYKAGKALKAWNRRAA